MTTFMSCEEFLEEKGHSEYTGEVLSTTEQGMEALINSCYTGLRFIHGNEDYILMTEVGTDTYTSAGHYDANPFNTYGPGLNGSSLENGYIWKYLYLALNTTNATLEFLPESPLTEQKKAIRKGEILFLRAHYLWNITEIYGPAHFSTETVKDKQLTAYHTPVETFYDQIFEDLNYAEANLPETPDDYGRATKWAARAALARMYLYRKDYQKAFEYAKMLIDNPDFELAPSFADLFDIANDEYANNHEIIWSVQFAHQDEASSIGIDFENSNDETNWPMRKGNGMHLYYLPYYQQETFQGVNPVLRDLEYGRAFVRFEPTLFLLDLYDETMDNRYWQQFQHVFLCNNPDLPEDYPLAVGDTAIYYTKDVAPDWMKNPETAPYLVFDRNSMYDENGLPIGDRRVMYGLIKFRDPTRLDKEIENSGRDVFIFRLAEMYFIAAEAQHYLGNNNLAADYLNVIRRRAAIPGKEADMEITAADIDIDYILDEKGREFAGEYIRWFDLKRTNKLVERVRLHNPDCSVNIQEHHMLRPIPQTQLNSISNSNEFKQNPGYN
jgi:hypothetical protein